MATTEVTKLIQRVVVMGASLDPLRYSNRAIKLLLEKKHEVIPVNPSLAGKTIAGLPVLPSIKNIENIDTVSMYINPANAGSVVDDIISAKPKRIIFNPGSEVSKDLLERLAKSGIHVEEACTLVMLRSNQFSKM